MEIKKNLFINYYTYYTYNLIVGVNERSKSQWYRCNRKGIIWDNIWFII